MKVVTTVNGKKEYLEQCTVLLHSLAVNSSNTPAVVSMVDVDNALLKDMQRRFPMHDIRRGENSVGNIGGFMVCYRTTLVRQALEEFKEPVLWMDVDTVVRGDLCALGSGLPENFLKVMVRNKQPPKMRFQAGVVCFGYSDGTTNMVRDWEARVRAANRWWADQELLWRVYTEHKESVHLVEMTIDEHCCGNSRRRPMFRESSVIWHCKKKHFNDKHYQAEYRRYLEEVTA